MVLLTVIVPPSLYMAPPRVPAPPTMLPEKVLLTMVVRDPGLPSIPPPQAALLPEKVLLVTVIVPVL
jgi:hypothetical protein